MLYGLKEARKQKGLTQAQLAELLGVSRTRITNLETGYTDSLKVSELSKLKELGFSLDEIFKGELVA